MSEYAYCPAAKVATMKDAWEKVEMRRTGTIRGAESRKGMDAPVNAGLYRPHTAPNGWAIDVPDLLKLGHGPQIIDVASVVATTGFGGAPRALTPPGPHALPT
jgi:hypothetical protein